jgi:hypothetical protein
MSGTETPQDLQERIGTVAGGWRVRLTSYRLGERWLCVADNVDPGANLAHSEGTSREEAEEAALLRAAELLARTRVYEP